VEMSRIAVLSLSGLQKRKILCDMVEDFQKFSGGGVKK